MSFDFYKAATDDALEPLEKRIEELENVLRWVLACTHREPCDACTEIGRQALREDEG